MAVWVLLVTALSSFVAINTQRDCPLLQSSDLGNTTSPSTNGLIAVSLMALEEEDGTPSVHLMDHQIVCLALGSGKDLYRMVSVIARFTSSGEDALVSTMQFHFECDNGTWSNNVSGDYENAVSNSSTLEGNLTTALRRDCRLCTDSILSSPEEHCVACDGNCTGLMGCDMTGNVCCNYFGLNGTCVQECPGNSSSDEDFQCQCNSGFDSNGQDCVNIDDCLTNPCQNGTCTDLIKGYFCSCFTGYTGKNCSTNIDDCTPNPCVRGNCTDMENDYFCICPPGYSGKNCSIDTNDCSPSPCQNEGTCVDGLDTFSCVCTLYWTGSQCESCLIPNCTECLADSTRQNNTICVRCIEGLYLTSPITCGNLTLTAGSNPGTFSSECPSEQTREGILDNVLQLISSQFDIHPIGLSRAFAASSCEQALSLHPHGSGHLFWILGENIQLQQCH